VIASGRPEAPRRKSNPGIRPSMALRGPRVDGRAPRVVILRSLRELAIAKIEAIRWFRDRQAPT